MKRLLVCLVAPLAMAGVEEDSAARKEARDIVDRAYALSRNFCEASPGLDHTITLKINSEESVTITVKCDVVNAYFGHEVSKPRGRM